MLIITDYVLYNLKYSTYFSIKKIYLYFTIIKQI